MRVLKFFYFFLKKVLILGFLNLSLLVFNPDYLVISEMINPEVFRIQHLESQTISFTRSSKMASHNLLVMFSASNRRSIQH